MRGTAIVTRDGITLYNITKLPSGHAITAELRGIWLINIYAPSSAARRQERGKNYNEMTYLLRKALAHMILGGDFNCVLSNNGLNRPLRLQPRACGTGARFCATGHIARKPRTTRLYTLCTNGSDENKSNIHHTKNDRQENRRGDGGGNVHRPPRGGTETDSGYPNTSEGQRHMENERRLCRREHARRSCANNGTSGKDKRLFPEATMWWGRYIKKSDISLGKKSRSAVGTSGERKTSITNAYTTSCVTIIPTETN